VAPGPRIERVDQPFASVNGALVPSTLPVLSERTATIGPGLAVPVRAVVRYRVSKVEPVAGATAAGSGWAAVPPTAAAVLADFPSVPTL
jgi:hypothetical protein